jgi:glutamate/tyrosine decarboxylase-like PLP-dependent enzyme
MTTANNEALVLSLSPSARGFGFVLFESALAPYDWGVQETRGDGKNRRILAFAAKMIDRYKPLVLVIEDWADGACRRSARILALYAELSELARKKSVQLVRISKQRLHGYFKSVVPTTKYEIALAVARLIPAFSFQIPPVRRIWMSEDPRQTLYDAAALGLAHFAATCQSPEITGEPHREIDWA